MRLLIERSREMTEVKVENPNYKVVRVKENKTVYPLYYHQTQALEKLTVLNRNKRFRTLLVLPTGERVIIN